MIIEKYICSKLIDYVFSLGLASIGSELASKDTPQSSNDDENVDTNICTELQNMFLENNLK